MDRCKILLVIGLLALAAGAVAAQETQAADALEMLRARIMTHLAQPKFAGAQWGIKVTSLDSGQTIFENHADRWMSPASNTKLYVAALALDHLGSDYRFATPLYATGAIDRAGTLRGDLVVVGNGDPTWNARWLGTNFWSLFEPYVAILTNAGVKCVKGDLVADATAFQGPPTGSSWEIDDLSAGNASLVSALTLDDNLVQVRIGPGARAGAAADFAVLQPGTELVFSNQAVTVAADGVRHIESFRPFGTKVVYLRGQIPMGGTNQQIEVAAPQPAQWFGEGLKLALARQDIAVRGKIRGVMWPEPGTGLANASDGKAGAARRLGAVCSPPLREVIGGFMKESQNVEADLLLAHLGELNRKTDAPSWQTSEEAGIAELQRFLAGAGIQAGDVQFDEGSGLSRNNLTTARATVALLEFMARHREAAAFTAALPVGGVDGSLAQRFVSTPAAGNVKAKTGTLHWAQTLSGYVTTAAGEHLAFSIMLNRFVAQPGHSGHEEIDPIVVWLSECGVRSDKSRGR